MNNKITNWSQLRFSVIGGYWPDRRSRGNWARRSSASRVLLPPSRKDEWVSFGARPSSAGTTGP